ncbi:MAG: hypothetical protein FWC91_13245 [Defluviitaleaceae bacterium]|nr:hypothetical protein [Defluviitaleaceae bacterium]
MKQELKWVNFYNLALFREGADYDGFKKEEDIHGIKLCNENMGDVGGSFYLSPVFDTREKGSTFNRLVLEGQFESVRLEIIVAASDRKINLVKKSVEEIKAELTDISHISKIDTTDILLHDLKGRFIWVLLIFSPKKDGLYGLKGMRMEFPKYSFIEYFPEVYQEVPNDFFTRYISIFQSMFIDVEKEVDKIPLRLDYRSAPDDDVKELSTWLGIDNTRGLFNTEKLRKLIKDIDIYQGKRGTKEALVKITELLTGIRPTVVEHFQWEKDEYSDLSDYKELYGNGSYCFCVILDLTQRNCEIPMPIKMNIRNSDLEHIIENYCLMGTKFKVMYLYPSCCVNDHCYLDVNASLSMPEELVLDDEAITIGDHIIVG